MCSRGLQPQGLPEADPFKTQLKVLKDTSLNPWVRRSGAAEDRRAEERLGVSEVGLGSVRAVEAWCLFVLLALLPGGPRACG